MVEKDVVLDGYDELAETYLDERSPGETERRALASFIETLPPDARVLDAGCGAGVPVLRALTGRGRRAIGMDFSSTQLAMAASNAPDARLLRGDMVKLPLKDGSIDAVVAFHSLIHLPANEHAAALQEIARVLRPGGQLLVSEGPEEWAGTNPDWLDADAEMQWHVAGADTTRRQLERAGFRIRDEFGPPDPDAGEERWVFFEARLDSPSRDVEPPPPR